MLCSRCKFDQPRSEFGPSAEMWPDRRLCKKCELHSRNRRPRHGITQEQRQEIVEYQGGCAVCGHPEPGGKGWVVDHDRIGCCDRDKSCPKCRRGVICQWCNSVLGYAFDRRETLRAAIEYLDRHELNPCAWHMPVACAPSICESQMLRTDSLTDKDGDVQDLCIDPRVTQRARESSKTDAALNQEATP